MRKQMIGAALAATTMALAVALPAQAQTRNAPAATSSAAAAGNDWGTYVGAAIGDSDLDTTLKLFGGQAINRNLGWEASYIDFGSVTNRAVTTEAWGIGAALVGVLPINAQLSGFGKAGVYYVKSEVRTPVRTTSDSGVEFGAGLGLRYALTSQASLRVEFETIGGEGGDVISVGAQLRF